MTETQRLMPTKVKSLTVETTTRGTVSKTIVVLCRVAERENVQSKTDSTTSRACGKTWWRERILNREVAWNHYT
jgi:hypothetical protein